MNADDTSGAKEEGNTSPSSLNRDLLLPWERALANIIAEVREEEVE